MAEDGSPNSALGPLTRRRALAAGGIGAGVLAVGTGAWLASPPRPRDSPAWPGRAALPTARGEMKAAALDGRIHVPGGLVGARGRATDRLDVYDPAADAWTPAAPLPEPRNHHAVVATDGRVIVTGGNAAFGDEPERTVFAYEPASDAWERLSPMPAGRWGHGSAVLAGTVYVVGGRSTGDAATLAYDPATDSWERRSGPAVPREHLAVRAIDGSVYAAGGRWDGTNRGTVEVYDPDGDQWTERAPLPAPRSGAAAAVVDGRLHVVGGEDPSPVSGRVFAAHHVYDPTRDRWGSAEPLPVGLHGAAAATPGGRLFVIGGARRHGLLSVTAWSDLTVAYRPE